MCTCVRVFVYIYIHRHLSYIIIQLYVYLSKFYIDILKDLERIPGSWLAQKALSRVVVWACERSIRPTHRRHMGESGFEQSQRCSVICDHPGPTGKLLPGIHWICRKPEMS